MNYDNHLILDIADGCLQHLIHTYPVAFLLLVAISWFSDRSVPEINMKKVIQIVTETTQESTQLHNYMYHSSTNISCEQWEVIHGLWLTFQEILEYELTKLTA